MQVVSNGEEQDVRAGTDDGDEGDDVMSVALAYRQDGAWQVDLMPESFGDDLPALISLTRGQPGSIALVDVAHEFFLAVRLVAGTERLLLSDASAGADWDLAGDVLDVLDLDLPDDDEDEVVPAGDLEIFVDLGLGADDLLDLLDDPDAYADEMLGVLAERLGFGEPYERVVGAEDDA